MNSAAWIHRLTGQLPGWKVWYTGPAPAGFCAVPAPPGTALGEALQIPGRLGPYRRAQELRAAARERYGWDDYCDTCGVLVRKCGHRRPETPDRHA